MGVGEQILAAITRLEAKVDTLLSARDVSAVARVADSADLDGKNGDVLVRFKPKGFSGPDFKGKRFSQCTAEFLDAYAEALQNSADHPKPEKLKFAVLSARGAARARGWAARMRAGWKAPVDEFDQTDPDADDGYDDGPSYDD